LTRDNQRLGDIVAGTLVLRERSGLPAAAAIDFAPPRGLEQFAGMLDTSGMTGEQYQAVRTFLLRSQALLSQARASLALQLADPLAVRLRPPPPAGVSPELYLQCVAAAYQRRQRPASPDPASAISRAWQTVTPLPEVGGGHAGRPWGAGSPPADAGPRTVSGQPTPVGGGRATQAGDAARPDGARPEGTATPQDSARPEGTATPQDSARPDQQRSEGEAGSAGPRGGGQERAGFAPPG
jgi:hypothetical protein